jgi:hypothetical protein
MLLDATRRLGPGPLYDALWPTAMPPKPWDVVATRLFQVRERERAIEESR